MWRRKMISVGQNQNWQVERRPQRAGQAIRLFEGRLDAPRQSSQIRDFLPTEPLGYFPFFRTLEKKFAVSSCSDINSAIDFACLMLIHIDILIK
jgi:hypothetical protein